MRRMKAAMAAALWLGACLLPQAAWAQNFYQLRTYELLPASKARFHARFRDHAVRIMQRHGFDIAAIWEADHAGKPEFVYLLRWKSEPQMTAAWDAFLADEEWVRIKRETVVPGEPIVGAIDGKVMRLTDYSPGPP